jgi:hypothetical protein
LLTNDDLDECNGHSSKIDWVGILTDMYHYHLTNELPYGPGCFRGKEIGVFSSNGVPSPPPSPSPSPTSAPGPVPFLGALAALRWSSRLKKRCASTCLSSRYGQNQTLDHLYLSHSNAEDGCGRELRESLTDLAQEVRNDSGQLQGGDPLWSVNQAAIEVALHENGLSLRLPIVRPPVPPAGSGAGAGAESQLPWLP